MLRKQSKHGRAQVWSVVAMIAIWLSGGAGAWAAEAPAQVRTWTGAVSANWADAGNWTGGAAPGAADDVVIDGGKFQPLLDLTNGAVTIKSLTLGSKAAATLTFANGNVTDKILIVKGDVTVGTNGVLTHANETAIGTAVGDETQRLGLEIGGNLTIGLGGAIRVAGCGYAMGAGPYKAVSSSGGVHGGEGGFTTWTGGQGKGATSTPTYGSVTSPVTAGGGSGFGSAGGGVAVIRVVGRVIVDGVIDASGGGGPAKSHGAGAGGAVNIRAGELLGNGSISAKGGDGGAGGGGAGGGRIAVVLTKTATFGSVTMNAAGGAVVWKDCGYGAAGTIYLQGAGQGAGMLIVSNPPLVGVGGARTLIGPEVTGDLPADVRVLDRARYVVTRDTAVVLDNSSLWRHFQVQRCATVRTDDGKLEPWDLQPLKLAGGWPPSIAPKPATSTAPSMLPPVGWAGLAMDDSTWPRVRLPSQIAHETIANGSGVRPQNRDGATAALLVRGRFEVKNPAEVKSCRLSVDYVGGVVVTVNGKEAFRRHVPGDKPDLLALAEDYPKEVFASDACDRYAREISIPVALLRTGVNVLAIEVHAAPYTQGYVKNVHGNRYWDPIGLISAQLSISPAAAVAASAARPEGIQVWNTAPYDTIGVFDYGDPCESLRPVTIRAARNSVFSGRLMVSSDQTIKGLKATVSDLAQAQGGATLPASAVQVRYAVPVVTGAPPANASSPRELSGVKSSVAPHRFDGLLETIPAEIPVSQAPAPMENFHGRLERKAFSPGAVAPLWFTVRVPREAKPGVYEGRVTISAQGLPATNVPLRVSVGDWSLPDPKEFRMRNLAFNEPAVVAGLYGVLLWSDRHFELQGRSQALMAETGSRQFFANLCPVNTDPEGLVRWIKHPDGSYKHDFSAFDKYLDMVAKSVGKPFPLLLNCWRGQEPSEKDRWVSLLDPATGKISRMKQPALDSAEALALWKPVFDEVLKKITARGWLDVTALGWISTHGGPSEDVAALAKQLWPDAVWGILSHNVNRDYKDGWVKVRYARTVYSYGFPSVRGYRELLQPQDVILCNTYRWSWNDSTPLNDQRRVGEDIIMSGRDGISDFGVNGGGCGWPAGPEVSQLAMLYPGPDGPVATERFEMFREGVELAEALIFIERAIQEKKLSPELQQKAEKALEARSNAFIKDWFTLRDMPGAEEDAKLLGLAGEVARELGQK